MKKKWWVSTLAAALIAGAAVPVAAAPAPGATDPVQVSVPSEAEPIQAPVPDDGDPVQVPAPPAKDRKFTPAQRATIRAKIDEIRALRAQFHHQREQLQQQAEVNRQLWQELRQKLGSTTPGQDGAAPDASGNAGATPAQGFRDALKALRAKQQDLVQQLKQLNEDRKVHAAAARVALKAGNDDRVIDSLNAILKDESQGLKILEGLQSIQHAIHDLLLKALQHA
ncbi:MAG: hypothetical protein IRZ18_06680 [Clostridia bacterium]|nr:hypothetical protein [Clostridia bacterium]